jgi:hypothetical protein
MKRIHPSILLLLVAILAYGLLIPQLGFYWDDLPMSWIRYQLGPEAMTEYFSTNRPVWGLLYQLTTRILPQVPVYWQVFSLVWRWLGAIVVWAIVRESWKDKPRFALSVALLFLLYPGFNQQWGAYLYSHFFIVLFFFLLSLLLTLRRRTIAALIFSALNLWMMEYFFVLELTRVGLIWISLRDSHPNFRERLRPTFELWIPYLALFALAVLSRLFIFNNQIYEIGATVQTSTGPFAALLSIVQNFFSSIWTVTIPAWIQIFTGVDPSIHGTRTLMLYAAVILVVIFISYYAVRNIQPDEPSNLLHPVLLGLFMLPFAGVPFWATGLVISLAHPASRFTLPFMFGVSLIIAGLIEFIPRLNIRSFVLVLLVGLAAGRQFLWSVDYRRDWQAQKNLFWQMTWRAPGLKPNTLVLMNEELSFYADNSISAPLNWIYAPDNRSDQIDYVLFYPTNRLNSSLPAIEPDIPIRYDYLAGKFTGNTSQTVAFYYSESECLRLLESFDVENRLLPADSLMREAAALSNADRILANQGVVMPAIYGAEPAHGWCYYFEKADLARQMGEWNEVVILADEAFELDEHFNDPVELFVFIEGYAHVGDWERAIELSKVSYRVSKDYVGPLLCRLWERMETETSGGLERSEALNEARNVFACNP